MIHPLRERNYWVRGMMTETGLTHDELAVKMTRTDQHCVCERCGKYHRQHPYAHEARDQDGEPYLHVLCDGSIVKL